MTNIIDINQNKENEKKDRNMIRKVGKEMGREC